MYPTWKAGWLFIGTAWVMAAFGLRQIQGSEIGGAGHPVRQIAAGAADDVDAAPTIKEQRSACEVREDGKIEIALEVGARHEASEQARQRDLHLARLSQRLLEDEGRARTGRGEQGIQNGPCTISSAGGLKHLADARILDLGNFQIDGRAGNGARGAGSKLWMKVRVTALAPA